LVREHFGAGLDPEIRAAVEGAAAALGDAGADVVDVSLPVAGNPEYCIGTYYIIAMGEASANLARYDGIKYGYRARDDGVDPRDLLELYCRSRSRGFGTEVKRRIMLGTYVLSAGYYDAYYLKAQKVRSLMRRDFEEAFGACDLILSPVAPTTAFRIGEQIDDPLQMYLNDIYTVSVNLVGIPGISVPVASSSAGLPIGAQLLAPSFGEEPLLRAARALELAGPPNRSN
jgi:aspartyl-tRNA(Asn)/glutamyl-tRNA(Gln) amidotransferase subunit A